MKRDAGGPGRGQDRDMSLARILQPAGPSLIWMPPRRHGADTSHGINRRRVLRQDIVADCCTDIGHRHVASQQALNTCCHEHASF